MNKSQSDNTFSDLSESESGNTIVTGRTDQSGNTPIRQRYTLTLADTPGNRLPTEQRLRAALKRLLRNHGFRCVACQPVSPTVKELDELAADPNLLPIEREALDRLANGHKVKTLLPRVSRPGPLSETIHKQNPNLCKP